LSVRSTGYKGLGNDRYLAIERLIDKVYRCAMQTDPSLKCSLTGIQSLERLEAGMDEY
jgi:hypothetical protein